ncbi:hypothetical protein [Deinococcus frigens]|uniref:hypothetical protein n=1 Tax=Deinococcus frigens TaxID=249403 RepID=UPI000A6F475C|nr:hypothetical protein [Deinococcus frigens]
MTLNTRLTPAFPLSRMQAPQSLRSVRPADELFGGLVLEAVRPTGPQDLPVLPHWELRAWPVARLGDVTLEARPLLPWLGPDDLRAALREVGWTPLGPVRGRRG